MKWCFFAGYRSLCILPVHYSINIVFFHLMCHVRDAFHCESCLKEIPGRCVCDCHSSHGFQLSCTVRIIKGFICHYLLNVLFRWRLVNIFRFREPSLTQYLKCSVEWEDVNHVQCKFDPFVLFWKVNTRGHFISIEGYKPVGFQF